MQYRNMGRWGVKLSVIGLGSYLTIGFKTDDKTARKTIQVAYDGGVNFFDTADAYNKGAAETYLGKALGQYPRESYFLLTKCWLNITGHVNGGGLSAKHIVEACNASLKRLKMEYIDLYMCHRPDWDTPLDEYELGRAVHGYRDLKFVFSAATGIIGEWWANLVNAQFGIPVAVGCTAVSAPKYFAYYKAGQMFALLGGLKGAAEYEKLVREAYPRLDALTTAEVFYAGKGSDVQSVVYTIITLFIILGNVAFFVERSQKRN